MVKAVEALADQRVEGSEEKIKGLVSPWTGNPQLG